MGEALTELLGDRYEVGPVIGRGGMAEVRLGRDTRLGRDVAVKLLRPDLARDPSFHGRFRREAQAAASLDGPNVVSVFDTGDTEDGVPWIVMEHVEGRTLRDILSTEGRLLPRRALEVAVDVCAALEVAHRAGIVHRDIKPANVMLTSQGDVKVMDFGIARAAAGNESTMTHTEAVIGTAAYLSPEQARGEHVDARSDLYSTGCLLYELLTGTPPFVGDSAVAVAYQHVREVPLLPSSYVEGLPPDIDAVVLKAMAKQPDDRYTDADEMREDLLRAAAGEPVTAAVPAALDPVVVVESAADQRPHLVWGVYAVLALVAAVASGLVVHRVLSGSNDLIKPPAVIGMSQTTAVQQLFAAGLRVDKVAGVFDERPVGTVLAQSPDKNFFVRRGGTVDLTVSRGPELTSVPFLLGLSVDEASSLLEQAKLGVKVVERDGNFPEGQVLEASPAPGARLRARESVTLTVASGMVVVPDVRGLTQEEAIARLTEYDFAIGLRSTPSTATPGTVLAQTPLNQLVRRGSDVVLDIAVEPGEPTPSPTTDAES